MLGDGSRSGLEVLYWGSAEQAAARRSLRRSPCSSSVPCSASENSITGNSLQGTAAAQLPSPMIQHCREWRSRPENLLAAAHPVSFLQHCSLKCCREQRSCAGIFSRIFSPLFALHCPAEVPLACRAALLKEWQSTQLPYSATLLPSPGCLYSPVGTIFPAMPDRARQAAEAPGRGKQSGREQWTLAASRSTLLPCPGCLCNLVVAIQCSWEERGHSERLQAPCCKQWHAQRAGHQGTAG